MRTDDIVNGEGMGDWNDRSSLRPGENPQAAKRYSSIGTKTLMGKPPATKRRMGAALLSHNVGPYGQGSNQNGASLAQNGSMVLNQSSPSLENMAPPRTTHDGLSNHDIPGSYKQERKARMNYNQLDYSDVYLKKKFTGPGAATRGRVHDQVFGKRGLNGEQFDGRESSRDGNRNIKRHFDTNHVYADLANQIQFIQRS